jgi:DNA (cytosine-5)-methyltransferase 1
MASKPLLVRDVPDEVRQWIAEQSALRGLSKNQFLVTLLKEAHGGPQLGLGFDEPPRVETSATSIPFSFIDLFAGIGGLRLGLEAVGGKALFSSEWDDHCKRTYFEWFKETPKGDINKVGLTEIPDHDVLAAGFPCQPFSIAGVSKKNSLGRAHGFKDATQGNLFFKLANIIESKRPPVILLENVKNLQSHDGGRTWEVIHKRLRSLEYAIFAKVINASAWVPQNRERIFIVGFDERIFGKEPPFEFPERPSGDPPRLGDILEPDPDPKYTLSSHLWRYLQDYAKKHQEKGNGFGFGIGNPDGITRTLSARYFKDGSEILIRQEKGNPRRLTPRECARLMGFPDHLRIVVSDTQAYRQFGNAVVPPVAAAVASQIVKVLQWHVLNRQNGCLIGPSVVKPRARARA